MTLSVHLLRDKERLKTNKIQNSDWEKNEVKYKKKK
jgi:hypothetical protein